MNKLSSKILKVNPVLVVNYNAPSTKLIVGSYVKLKDDVCKNSRSISTTSLLSRSNSKIQLTKSKINMQKTKQLKFTSDYIQSKVEEYNLGTRRLALIMGKDPENFSQTDIDEAIKYLFPSDLDDDCVPKLKHPEEVFPLKTVIETDIHGRPMNTQYFTGNPQYNNLMHEIYEKRLHAQGCHNKKVYEDLVGKKKRDVNKTLAEWEEKDERLNVSGTNWATKDEIEKMFFKGNKLSDDHYYQIREQVARLMDEPMSYMEQDYIMQFRTKNKQVIVKEDIPVPQQDADGRHFVMATGNRKTTDATIKLIYPGSGKITVNEKDFGSFFFAFRSREIVIAPFSLLGYQRCFDVEAKVEYPVQLNWNKRERAANEFERGSGAETNRSSRTQHAVAMRLAISRALRSFVSPRAVNVMRMAGLLNEEIKKKERKLPGRRKARKKKQWNKR